MNPYYQLTCTIVALILNSFLIYLIIFKSSKHTGKYKYLMIYTCVFEIMWAIFDVPAEVESYSHGYVFVVFRVNHSWSWLTEAQSTLVAVIYTGIFGASLAVFGAHFIYRYGFVNQDFGRRFTSGWKFGLLFVIPIIFGIWWATSLAICCYRTQETDDYSRKAIWDHYHLRIEDLSYVSATYYRPTNKTLEIRWRAWIGAGNMLTMLAISMFCVFFFAASCYLEISKKLTELGASSRFASNIQKQLFYSLLLQTLIPITLMHIPMCFYFLCPMLNLDNWLASNFIISSITIYPAIDPLPSFIIIANYRKAVIGKLASSLNKLLQSQDI